MTQHHFDWIERHADRTPDKLAMVDLATGREFTYAQFHERVARLAHFMVHELDVRKDHRISILAKNSTDYFEILFACSRVGAVLNTLNWRLAVPELEYIIGDFSPQVLIYEPEFADTVDELQSVLPDCDAKVVVGGEGRDGDWRYEDAIAVGDPAGVACPQLAYEDTWAVLYTAGTTGRPKGAKVTYGNFFYNAVGMNQALDITSKDVNLTYLPTFHAGGLSLYATPVFHAGGTVAVGRDFDPVELLRNIETWKATVMVMVPPMYLMLDRMPEFDQFDLSSMRCWTSGGSALPSSLAEMVYEKRKLKIRQGYGMTESGPTVFMIPDEDAVRKAGSVGKPVLHQDVRVLDADGNQLGPNEVGELCFKGNVTTGYWNRPDATAETIVDGWLHSGDAGMVDDEGFYYVVDRIKDMFISGGENVYPAEIEDVLYQLPEIAEVAVIGVPDPKWQEVAKAVVVLKQDQTLTEEQLIDFCQGKLARYKVPKSAAFVGALPRNDIGKVLKRDLREQFKE